MARSEEQSDRHAGGQANDHRRHALANDQPKQLRALRAERHPNADFVPAAGHRVRDNAVDAEAGHQKRGSGKDAHKGQLESARGYGADRRPPPCCGWRWIGSCASSLRSAARRAAAAVCGSAVVRTTKETPSGGRCQ